MVRNKTMVVTFEDFILSFEGYSSLWWNLWIVQKGQMSGIIKVRFKLRIVLWIVLLWSCFDCYEGVIPFEHGLKYMDEVIWF
jgi:hypothetical protein